MKEIEKIKSSRPSTAPQFVPTAPVEFCFHSSSRKSVLHHNENKEIKSETSSVNGDERKNHEKPTITVPVSPKLSQRSYFFDIFLLSFTVDQKMLLPQMK